MLTTAIRKLEKRLGEIRAARDARAPGLTEEDIYRLMREPPARYPEMTTETLLSELADERAVARIIREEFGDVGDQRRRVAIEAALHARGVDMTPHTQQENR